MLFWRKLLKTLRGQVSPFQVFAACIIGSSLGFMPGLTQAAGLIALLTLLLIVLNTNFFLAALSGLFAGLVSLAALPVSFHIGRFLLDGPTQPLFEMLINAPVTALFGLETYATTGGLVLGVAFGIVFALIVIKLLGMFRKRMASLEQGSERYQRWTSKRWVKITSWLLAGGGPKQGYQAMLEARSKLKPIRWLGVALVVGVLALGWLAQAFVAGPLLTPVARAGLERANGATVDLNNLHISLRHGSIVLEGLALADPNDLQRDIFRADRLEGDLSVADLLRKRIAIDRLEATNASSGRERARPGFRLPSAPRPEDDEQPRDDEERSIQDYLDDVEVWRERLAQVRQWLERLEGPGEAPETAEERERLRERLERRAAELGYAHVRAEHLVSQAPTLLIYELDALSMYMRGMEDDAVDLEARYISTHPHLVDEPTRVTLRSSSGRLAGELLLDGARRAAPDEARNTIDFALNEIPGDQIGRLLAVGERQLISGGTVDIATQGSWRGRVMELPLAVTLHDNELRGGGYSHQLSGSMPLSVALYGQIDDPRVRVDERGLMDNLVRAGAEQLAGRVREHALGYMPAGFGEEASQIIDLARDGDPVEAVRDRAQEEADRRAEEARQRAEEEARDRLDRFFR